MIIQSHRIWAINTWIDGQIEIENGTISNIYPYDLHPADIDYGDWRIVPGFIDGHCHGAYGFDTNDAEPDGLRHWAKHVVSEGVTSFCPTTITQSEEVLINALKNVAAVKEAGNEGAHILGIHFEGPYLDQTYKGAQPEQYCVKPDVEQFKRYWEASHHNIRIITMACEHDTDFALTKYCTSQGIVVSQGHSSATFEQASMAIANGARSMTHVYNGMTKFHHRQPGMVGAAFYYKDVYGEIICDTLHSSKDAIRIFFENKGPDHAVMITDSLRVKGMAPGTRALFGGNLIELQKDGTARLVKEGNLAGSTLKVNDGLRNVVEKALVPWNYAVNACTLNPARMLRIDDKKGTLQVGKDADIVVLHDDYSVEDVFVSGKKQEI